MPSGAALIESHGDRRIHECFVVLVDDARAAAAVVAHVIERLDKTFEISHYNYKTKFCSASWDLET